MGRRRLKWTSSSPEETMDIGRMIGQMLQAGDLLCLFGDLAAGKTTLIKGIVQGVNGLDPHLVSSPTFVYLHPYEGVGKVVYHFDLYRLRGAADFLQLGFEEYFFSEGVCCIEWSERIEEMIPPSAYRLNLEVVGEFKRNICLS